MCICIYIPEYSNQHCLTISISKKIPSTIKTICEFTMTNSRPSSISYTKKKYRKRTACDDGMEITVDCISSLNFYSSYCNSLISFRIPKKKEEKNWKRRRKRKTTFEAVPWYYEFKEKQQKYQSLPKLIFQSPEKKKAKDYGLELF